MKRQYYDWSVTGAAGVIDAGVRYAHNSALGAGVAVVREVARDQGQTYSKGPVIKSEAETTVAWLPDRHGDPITVRVVRRA